MYVIRYGKSLIITVIGISKNKNVNGKLRINWDRRVL